MSNVQLSGVGGGVRGDLGHCRLGDRSSKTCGWCLRDKVSEAGSYHEAITKGKKI